MMILFLIIGARKLYENHSNFSSCDLIVGTRYWVIRYLEIETGDYWPDQHVLINTDWFVHVTCKEKVILVDLVRDAIKNAPDFERSGVIGRDYEIQLFHPYGKQVY